MRCASLQVRTVALLLMLAVAACAAPKKQPSKPAPSKPTAPVVKGSSPEERFDAALQLMKGNKLREAEAALAGLAREFPRYSGPFTNLGIIYAKQSRLDQAVNALNSATRINAENVVALNWLGIVLRQKGDGAGAEGAWRRALRAKPDYAAAHFNLGLFYEQVRNDPAAAIAEYQAYHRLVGDKDLRVLVWMAELEARRPKVQQPVVAPVPQQGPRS